MSVGEEIGGRRDGKKGAIRGRWWRKEGGLGRDDGGKMS